MAVWPKDPAAVSPIATWWKVGFVHGGVIEDLDELSCLLQLAWGSVGMFCSGVNGGGMPRGDTSVSVVGETSTLLVLLTLSSGEGGPLLPGATLSLPAGGEEDGSEEEDDRTGGRLESLT